METLGEISRPACIESLPLLLDFVENQIGMMSFSDETKKDICLAVEEGLKNIFYHGEIDSKTDINITFRLDNLGRFQIVITDYGRPFNMLLSEMFPWEIEEENKTKISTKIMKRVIKDIEYKRLDNKNILTFTIPRL